ncbi:MAG: hypothetical protein BWY71_02323 [Planctomycetes bacterium ADurb.Bin412]|nr:MAG: hypothetical protein BWY71_02323 [Planctomycetes bacterium ADurb.Bin412]
MLMKELKVLMAAASSATRIKPRTPIGTYESNTAGRIRSVLVVPSKLTRLILFAQSGPSSFSIPAINSGEKRSG